MPDLPNGVVTFLFTDVEGSTRAWEASPDLMAEALAQHDEAIMAAVAEHNGIPVKARGEGDSWFVVFPSAVDAVEGAAEAQRRLASTEWPTPSGLSVRASLHTGNPTQRGGDYYGPVVNRAARLRAIAHGGQTILSGSTHELVRDALPNDLTLVDLGEHGLKDLSRPEHVYQLDIDGLPSSFPPLNSLSAVPNNLPVQLTDFIGREKDVAKVSQLLDEHRLVTILAAGGTGKTRLAIQVAADLTGTYPDGVFFVPLADLTSDGDIVQAVAETLGLGLSTDDDRTKQLLGYLSGKRQLLVFDNFEHIRGQAQLISEILKAAPAVRVLATSRAKLNLTGEALYTLGGLDTSWGTTEEAARTSAVQLFVDGATRVDPSFELEDDDLKPLAKILQLTDGLPLAILLAAAWVDMLSVEEICEEIERSLDFLETETGDVPDRHRSVRAVFEYSWSLLTEDEREIFTALSVFRGGFTREGARTVTAASIRSLASLVSKSLVVADPAMSRYTVHELLRQYAEAELQADDIRCAQVQAAHAAYHAGITERAMSLLPASDEVAMLDLIETDLENIRAGWRFFVAGGDGEGLRKMIAPLYLIYEWRGWYPAAIELFDQVIGAFENIDDENQTIARELSRSINGWFHTLLGRAELGAQISGAGLDALPDGASHMDRWIATQTHAVSQAYLGDTEGMVATLESAVPEFEALDEPMWATGLKNWRSFAAILGGDYETAQRLLGEAMPVYETKNEHYYMVWALWLQAMMATAAERPHDAIELYTRQVARAKELGYLRGLVVAGEGLGDAYAAAELYEEAENALIGAIEVAEQMGMINDILSMMLKVARVRMHVGREGDAIELLESIRAHPASSQQSMIATESIELMAADDLEQARSALNDDGYATAVERGRSKSFDDVLNELVGRAGPIAAV